jgi:hypothetical protein
MSRRSTHRTGAKMIATTTQSTPRRFTLTQLAQLSGFRRDFLAGWGRNRWFPVAGVAHGEPLFDERTAMAVRITAMAMRRGGSWFAASRVMAICLRDDVLTTRFIRVVRNGAVPHDGNASDLPPDTLAVLDRQAVADRFRAVTSGHQPGGGRKNEN